MDPSKNKKTDKLNRKRHRNIKAALFCVVFLLGSLPLAVLADEGSQIEAPNEKILYSNGNWETAYWGHEGRMAYRYSGSSEAAGETPENAYEVTLVIESPTIMRSVVTVHKNDQDSSTPTLKSIVDGEASILEASWPQTDGDVSITDPQGNVLGVFPCKIGSPAVVNGEVQPYVLWVAETGELKLEPGEYKLVGSRPETLVMNGETGDTPAVLVKGVDAGKWQEYLDAAGDSRSFQGSYGVNVQDELGNAVSPPVEVGMVDKGSSIEIIVMVADMPLDQSLAVTSRSDNTIEAEGNISLLPNQGLFDLSVNTTIRLENGQWLLSGDWTLTQGIGGESQTSKSVFTGTMTGRDLPGYYFPKPAAGLGSLGNIPGPANEAQAAAGVVAPGLLALLASVLASKGGAGGGSGGAVMFMQPAGPIAPDGGNIPGSFVPAGAPDNSVMPGKGVPLHDISNTAVHPSNTINTAANSGQVLDSGFSTGHDSGSHRVSIELDKHTSSMEAAAPIMPHGYSSEPSLGHGINSANTAGALAGLTDKEGFMRIADEGLKHAGMQDPGSSSVSEHVIAILTEGEQKRRLIGNLESILKTTRGSADVTGEVHARISGLMDDLLKGRKNFIQANADVQQIQNMLTGRPAAGTNAVAESIQKAIGQVVDTSNGNVLNDFSMRIANDVATGGLSDLGFSGGDMLKTATRSLDADDMLTRTMSQVSALFVNDDTEGLSRQGLSILSPLFKPRTNIPEDLIKTAQNSAFHI